MADGQGPLTSVLDVAALNRVQHRLAAREATRGQTHAGQLRDALELHRIQVAAGHALNTVPQLALTLDCSEHRAQQLLDDAQLLVALPGALEAVECGLLTIEQSRKLADALAPLPSHDRLTVWGRLQAVLIDKDSPLPPARLGERLRAWIIEADPAAAAERRKQAESHRMVEHRRRADGLHDLGMLGMRGPDAQGCMQNIRRNAVSWGPDDTRTADQRHLDAAKDLLLGRSALSFVEDQHCQPGCDCRSLQPAPCGADLIVHVPLGAALCTTDEPATLVGHGPLEPDLLHDLLMAAPVLRAVFVDEHGTPVADSPLVLRPPRNDPAAIREALLQLAASAPGPLQPRHPDDHPPPPPPRPGPPDSGPPDRSPPSGGMSVLKQLARLTPDRVRAAARPALLAHAHPVGTPGAYRFPRRLVHFLRARSPRCEWPGCGAAAINGDLDHDLPWPFGPTCSCNIGPLCRRHHRCKQTGWGKQRTAAGVRWTSPSGSTWRSPSQHQPPQPPVRPLPPLPVRTELDDLSPLALEDELWHLDPGSPTWDDPAAHELRADDTESDDTDGFPTDTTWTLDLDDPYAWLDLQHPADAS